MFERFKKQQYGLRHLVPTNMKARKRSSKALFVQLRALQDTAAPIHSSFSEIKTESDILKSAQNTNKILKVQAPPAKRVKPSLKPEVTKPSSQKTLR